MLVLDRSGSMMGTPLADMKLGARTFIDIIDQATDSSQDGQIGSGSRLGIVSFSNTATADTQLITSVDTLKAAVDSLAAAGSTNHADAFTKAAQLFDPASPNAKVMVLFTDGNTTTGGPPAPAAAAARAQGITIYCIGLIGSDGLDVSALNHWATDPDASHVAVTPDAADLEALFGELAANISKPGATDIVIHETVQPDFVITSILSPSKGSATMLDARSLRWNIAQLGVTTGESATLDFLIRHVGQQPGTIPVNESITYQDREGNLVTFPQPTVAVDCDIVVHPEPCPQPVGPDGGGLPGRPAGEPGGGGPVLPGPDSPAGCDFEGGLPGKAGGPGRHPHRVGPGGQGAAPGHENPDHPRPQRAPVPGCAGQVHPVCGA